MKSGEISRNLWKDPSQPYFLVTTEHNMVIFGEELIEPAGEDDGAFVDADFQSEICSTQPQSGVRSSPTTGTRPSFTLSWFRKFPWRSALKKSPTSGGESQNQDPTMTLRKHTARDAGRPCFRG